MQSYALFNTAHKKLNEAQKKAVDTITGPVMVVAGPGTGKTHILTLRVANILKLTDTPPNAILALTFTEAGVDAMKKKLFSFIGPTAYKVNIHTFHAFCNDVIHTHPEYFPRIISSTALTDIESILFIRECLTTLTLDKLKPFGDPYFYVPSIRSAISTLKREHKTPAEVLQKSRALADHLINDPESYHQKGAYKGKMKGVIQTQVDRLKKEQELGVVFEWYEIKMDEKKKFDFEDMINEVVRALETDSEFRLMIQEKYLYLLADEHQDANGSQNKLLELLSSYDSNPNLFIVGDEKQAIFRFQGATLDSFEYFHSKFPQAIIIALTESYRSGSVLLNAAHSLMKEVVPAERHPALKSRVEFPQHAVLEVRQFTSEEMELAWLVSEVERKISEGVPMGDIAIMYRTNNDAKLVSRALSQKGILHTFDSKSSIFDNHTIRQLLTYLRLVTHIGSDEYLSYALHFPWLTINSHDVYKIIIYGQKHRMPYLEVISSREKLKEAKVFDIEGVYAHSQILMRLSKLVQQESARDFFDYLLRDSGLLKATLARADAITILNAIRGLVNTLELLSSSKSLYTGLDFVHDLGLYEEYGIEIEPDTQPRERSNAVHLVTAHRSKGLEYEYVYIIHTRNQHWGNRISRDKLPLSTLASIPESDLDDERRLFYVALTRAKKYVSVSYGTTSSTRSKESDITQFMGEIDQALISEIDTTPFEVLVKPEDIFIIKPTPESIGSLDFLRDTFVEQGLSATALNNYLECPWKYFYRNLVRVPEKPTSSSLYGNALHNALRLFRDLSSSTHEYQSLSQLLEYLKISIDQQGFTPATYEDAYLKGVRALTDWHKRNEANYQYRAMCEKKFELYMPSRTGEPKQILLRGLIDVIEFRDNDTVHVIDYKTGKHKSRNELEGNTKDASGDYKRQLDFYCILLELTQMQAPSLLSLEFIEPDQKGNTVVHDFEYDVSMINDLKTTIECVANEIYTLAFWSTKCDEKECEYCAMHALTLSCD